MTINPYLTFDGDALDALEFYAELFGSTVEAAQTVGDSPIAGDVPEHMHDRLLHARVDIGSNAIMASDALQPGQYQPPQNTTLQTAFDDLDKARRVFNRLAKGGEVTMPFEPTFWAKGFGMCRDRFGVLWMVNCD